MIFCQHKYKTVGDRQLYTGQPGEPLFKCPQIVLNSYCLISNTSVVISIENSTEILVFHFKVHCY